MCGLMLNTYAVNIADVNIRRLKQYALCLWSAIFVGSRRVTWKLIRYADRWLGLLNNVVIYHRRVNKDPLDKYILSIIILIYNVSSVTSFVLTDFLLCPEQLFIVTWP